MGPLFIAEMEAASVMSGRVLVLLLVAFCSDSCPDIASRILCQVSGTHRYVRGQSDGDVKRKGKRARERVVGDDGI